MDKKDRLKQIPLELVKALYTSHTKKRKLSLGSVTRMYKITRQTVINRIKDTKNKRWRNWNYADEDIEYKYSDKRVDKE